MPKSADTLKVVLVKPYEKAFVTELGSIWNPCRRQLRD